MEYQLELKQLVDYPRCRIYREFLRQLMEDKGIRTSGNSYLFYYMVLCSYANYRSSYRRLEGISYLVNPGEWICKTSELSGWFRFRFQHQAISVLDYLQKQHYITYTRLGRGSLIKFRITDWEKYNTAFNYNYPCLKDVGFFFFQITAAHELVSMGRCSEMDIVLDLWLHAIYNDEQVQGSDLGPVVYYRNNTGSPLISYADLGVRWGISKATVSRILGKLQEKKYLSLVTFNGRHGSVIYLQSYLSTMFNISDVMVDKDEVSLSFQIPVHISEKTSEPVQNGIKDEQITIMEQPDTVSSGKFSVSKSDIRTMLQKLTQILAAQGISCCECPNTLYKLYPLSDCMDGELRYSLQIDCPDRIHSYRFDLTCTLAEERPKTANNQKERK